MNQTKIVSHLSRLIDCPTSNVLYTITLHYLLTAIALRIATDALSYGVLPDQISGMVSERPEKRGTNKATDTNKQCRSDLAKGIPEKLYLKKTKKPTLREVR